jgi:hypothetical protein
MKLIEFIADAGNALYFDGQENGESQLLTAEKLEEIYSRLDHSRRKSLRPAFQIYFIPKWNFNL